jgi:type IV fimbrial biogenesis protein FimT
MSQKQQRGFTLIELMVTIIVAAVLVSLAVPSFRDLIDKSRLRGATDDIVNLLNIARASAVKLQRDVNVSIDATNWCAGAVSAGNPGAVGDAVPAVAACDCTATTVACKVDGLNSLVSASSYSSVTVASPSATNTMLYDNGGITFNSKFGALDLSGLANLSSLTVTSPSGKYSTQITVSPLGQTYVCSQNSKFVSGYPSC